MGGATAGDSDPATSIWSMPYADDTAVVLQSPEQPRNMIIVITTACSAFGLTVSMNKTEIVCLRMKWIPDAAATFGVETSSQKRACNFVNLGVNVNHDTDCPSKSTGAEAIPGTASRGIPSNYITDIVLPSS